MTVRCVIVFAMFKDWNLYQIDVYNVFLLGDLDEKLYMEMLEGFKKSRNTKDM